MAIVYTIGYGGRKIPDFINLLKIHNIKILVDVRRFPNSKNPDFKKENLEVSLPENGIEYIFLGDELGGFRKDGFEKHMDTIKFMDGFKSLLDLIEKETAVIMCMEKKTEHCHRKFISHFLEDINIEVIHI